MAAEMWKDVPKSIPTAASISTCFRKPVPKKRKTWMNGQKHGKAYRNLRNSHSPHGKPDVESCVSPWKLRPRASRTGVSCAPEIHGCRKIRSFHSAAICQRLFLFWVVQKKGRNARKARIATICCRLGAEGQRCSAASRKMQRSLCFSARTGRLSVWRQRNTAEKKEEGPGKQQALLAQKKRVFMGEEEERVRTGKNTVSGYVTH